MDIELTKIIKSFAKDIIKEARFIMSSDIGINRKTGTNTLKDSDLYRQIDWSFREEGKDIIIDTLFNYYIVFVDSGRRAGAKMPPIDAIIKWLRKKNIAPLNKNIRSTAFLIARSIKEQGIAPRPIFGTLFESADEKWDNEWSQRLFDTIIKELNDYFNS